MADSTRGKAHFVGIGGIGISALAQLYHHDGWEVVGTNNEVSHATLDRIRDLGVTIHLDQNVSNIDPDTKVIIYSSAWETLEPEFMSELRGLGIPMLSYFEALGLVSAQKRTIAISGTHGKTTTTAMLAKILVDAGVKPTVIVGSIVKDFGSNFLPGLGDQLVVEACEYERHFLELSPEILVITNIDFDHSDYYKDLSDVQSAFRSLMEKVPEHGYIITDTESPSIAPILSGLRATVLDYMQEPSYPLQLPGEFNEMNARAAAAGAKAINASLEPIGIAQALNSFHGTWRRFENRGTTKAGVQLYDDYAHHPTEIKETLRALRTKTDGDVYVAFHPHLFSRTRDLFDGFTRAFSDADHVLIAPIFAAREIDDGSVSNESLAAAIRAEGIDARALAFEDIVHVLTTEPKAGDVIMTMGAGDIYKVADLLTQK